MDRIAIVTGGSRGIGAATCRLLGEQGYAVAVNYRTDQAAAERVVGEVEAAGGKAIAVQADTGVSADIERLFATVDERLGPVTALVNNAGMVGPRGRFEAVGAGDMERVLAVNVIGPALCTQAAVRRMSTRHGGNGGAIVNVSSVFGVLGRAGMGQYDTTKAAVLGLTRALAVEEAPHGVRVNAVCPGGTITRYHIERAARQGISEEELRGSRAHDNGLLGRWAEPREIAYPILFLSCAESSFITGTTLLVDAGKSVI